MAKKQGRVYLGYEDEAISEKNESLTNYNVNKIGGFPDWPTENIQGPTKCTFCGLYKLLIVQCYAPIERSIYHRSLYVFACINPSCWNQSESWVCVRSQIQDVTSSSNTSSAVVAMPSGESNLSWCGGADEWDENDNEDSANGNIMNVDNINFNHGAQRLSDEDEDSNSLEMDSVEHAIGNLKVYDAHNANMSPVQGAIGAIGGQVAAAEIEAGDDGDLVTVDTPTAPTHDLQQLLQQAVELPIDIRNYLASFPLKFTPKYIYVEEEVKNKKSYLGDRATELFEKYQRENDMESFEVEKGQGRGEVAGDDEAYEEATPLHGDKLFYAFATHLRENPDQILRYSRDEPPLLGAPVKVPGQELATNCTRCNSRLICELQLLPGFMSTLQLNGKSLGHLHCLSVLIFTCSESCWNADDSVVRETVVFQPEIV